MTTNHWIGLLFVAGFILLHFSSKFMELSTSDPRSPVLSFAGGVTAAYVFLYLIPELSHYSETINRAVPNGSWLNFFEDYTYFIALIGVLIYHGLDVATESSQDQNDDEPPFGFFMVHITVFFFYNMTIGYLLIREDFESYWAETLYFLALGVHFLSSDHALKELHKKDYDRYGRWFLAAAIFTGWLAGLLLNLPEYVAAIAVSLLAGGILLNIFKEEIREGKSNNYWAFLVGALLVSLFHMIIH